MRSIPPLALCSLLCACAAVFCLLLLLVGVPRMEGGDLGMDVARIGLVLGVIGGLMIGSGVGAILGLIGMTRRHGRGWAIAGLLLNAVLVASPFLLGARLRSQQLRNTPLTDQLCWLVNSRFGKFDQEK